MGFGKNFVWGAATSAYQIEGAAYEDGKGLNIWDVFCSQEGKVFNGHNGNTACDHYHRVDEDVALMAEMGLKAYRFSINWARILPKGTGEINQKGIDFYNHLINKLLEYQIEPYITIYHWDLPYYLHQRGGWLNPDIADWFSEYAGIISSLYSDRVKYFITINEPQIMLGLGYIKGEHAPGYQLSLNESLQIGRNIQRAHGAAVKAIREQAKQDVKIGIVIATSPTIPLTDSPEDIKAAEEAYLVIDKERFAFTETYWLDPIVLGKLPQALIESIPEAVPLYSEEDLKTISQPIDFIGTNIYQGNYIKAGSQGQPETTLPPVGGPKTAIGWPVTPSALYWGVRENCNRYHLPYYITENGMSAHDWVSLDNKVHDPNRIDYMQRYLLGFEQAANEGYPVAGYFAWSLFDNFEWAKGYSDRFGLVYVDFDTQKRIRKDSSYWYQKVIETNGGALHDL